MYTREKNWIKIIFFFTFQVASVRNGEDPESRNVEERQHKNDWPKWKEVVQAKLNSLTK